MWCVFVFVFSFFEEKLLQFVGKNCAKSCMETQKDLDAFVNTAHVVGHRAP